MCKRDRARPLREAGALGKDSGAGVIRAPPLLQVPRGVVDLGEDCRAGQRGQGRLMVLSDGSSDANQVPRGQARAEAIVALDALRRNPGGPWLASCGRDIQQHTQDHVRLGNPPQTHPEPQGARAAGEEKAGAGGGVAGAVGGRSDVGGDRTF